MIKSAQKNTYPHLEVLDNEQLKQTSVYNNFNKYLNLFYQLYDKSLEEILNRIFYLVNEKGITELEALNQSTVLLINSSKLYINIFIINCFLWSIHAHKCELNQKVLSELLEFYLLYEICDEFASSFLRVNLNL